MYIRSNASLVYVVSYVAPDSPITYSFAFLLFVDRNLRKRRQRKKGTHCQITKLIFLVARASG